MGAAVYDVVVVGGGPSGATAAYLLATHGRSVCLVDKKIFPRPKLCAGLLTWKCVELLNRVFGFSGNALLDNGIVTNTCRNYRVNLGPKTLVRRRLDFPFHFVDRSNYDHFWLRKAQQGGCHIITGQAVTRVDPVQGQVVLADGMPLKARTIIGADGVWSKVRKSISIQKRPNHKWHHQLAATIEAVHTCPPSLNEKQEASIHFGYLPWGYAWSFPGNGKRVVGIGGLTRKGSVPLSQYFRDFIKAIPIDVDQLSPWRSHPLPYGNHLQNPTGGRVLLVGDACGLADPLLGEGIYYAHRSGELAAQAILTADSDAANAPDRYRAALNATVLSELRWIKLYRNLLFAGGRKRQFHGLRLFLYLMPKRLEAAVQGQNSFSSLFWPRSKPRSAV